MKKLFFLLILSTTILAQEADTLLIKKYENRIKELQNLMQQRVDELVKNDAVCNQLQGAIITYQQLIEEEKTKMKKADKK